MTPRRQPAAGFALLEVLVSLTLLAVGLVAVLTGVLTALDVQKDTALRYRAGLLLQDKLAETLLVPYGGEAVRGVSADGCFDWTVIGAPWDDGIRDPADGNDGQVRIYEIVVDVSWQTDDGTRHLSATQLVGAALETEGAP